MELVYVPPEYETKYVTKLLDSFVADGGKLILAQYFSSGENPVPIDIMLSDMGFSVEKIVHGFDGEGIKKTNIAVIKK